MPSGDSGKIIRGSEFETEFDNIATAIATKADAADPTFTGTVTIDGLTVNGNTVLGNAATDTVTVTADIASNLLPSADDTYNLGASGAEWNDLYVDGTAYIDAIDFNGTAITATGTEINYLDITTLGTVEASKAVTADANGDVTFGDNDKAKFGAGSDLQIYHDGGNSRIYDQGTGALVMRSNQLNIQSPTGEKLAIFNQDNDVELYYDDSLKLATTNTGIDVTGSISADGLTVSSATDATITVADATLPTIQKLDLIHNAGSSTLISGNNGAYGSFTIQADDNANVINRFQINAGGDVSLYEDTGTTAKLFWDASAESLGIGTSSPDALLEINKGSEGEYLKVGGDNISNGRALTFTSSASSSGSVGALHTIKSSSVAGEIAFANGDGTIMYLKDGGNVGIGTTSPAANLEISSATGATLRLSRDDTTVVGPNSIGSIEFYTADSDSAGVAASVDGVADGSGGNVALAFSSGTGGSASEAMRIDSSGHVIAPYGVTLGTAVGTYAAANTLDDYEEGTWTPEIGDVTGNTGTTSTADGHYTKVGRLVTVVVDIINIDTTALVSSEQVRIKNLPFTAFTVGNQPIFTAITQLGGIGASGKTIIASIQDQFGYIRLKESDSGLASYLLVSDITSGTADIRFSLTYFTN